LVRGTRLAGKGHSLDTYLDAATGVASDHRYKQAAAEAYSNTRSQRNDLHPGSGSVENRSHQAQTSELFFPEGVALTILEQVAGAGQAPRPHPDITPKRASLLNRPHDSARAAELVEKGPRDALFSASGGRRRVVIGP
jgi:hypothetical protein